MPHIVSLRDTVWVEEGRDVQGPVLIILKQERHGSSAAFSLWLKGEMGTGPSNPGAEVSPDLPSLPEASAGSPHARPLLPIDHTSGFLASESPKTQRGKASHQIHPCPSRATFHRRPQQKPLLLLHGSPNHTQLRSLTSLYLPL